MRNTSAGVEIEVAGKPDSLDAFTQAITAEAPPLSRIESVTSEPAAPNGSTRFEIRHSEVIEGQYQPISPDVATCDDCLHEVIDPADRRYRYAFTNCTNCGPRFTIIQDIPYDRPKTTMAPFGMCPACQREYDDPLNRRFHAQPNACPVCGPRLELLPSPDRIPPAEWDDLPADEIDAARDLLRAGLVVAIKGVGGFHLACDATNPAAVQNLAPTQRTRRQAVRRDDARHRHGDALLRGELRRRAGTHRPRTPDCPAAAQARHRASLPRSRPVCANSASCCPIRRCTICCSKPRRISRPPW